MKSPVIGTPYSSRTGAANWKWRGNPNATPLTPVARSQTLDKGVTAGLILWTTLTRIAVCLRR
jgi:hypothetical protein